MLHKGYILSYQSLPGIEENDREVSTVVKFKLLHLMGRNIICGHLKNRFKPLY